jgi:cytosine/adenosine deaminase-related metal-dependent hydrolase
MEPGKALIMDAEGTVLDIVGLEEAGDNIETNAGILCPGLINAHCHLELSHMKGRIPKGTGLADFVYRVITQRQENENTILDAISKAEDDMYAEGIVAVGDICNNAMTLPKKLKGRIWYHNFIEATGFNPAIATERFQRSQAFFTAYSKMYSIPVESNSITPHASYSVSDDLWEKIIHFPGNHLFSIHNQESEAEDEWSKSGTGPLSELYSKLNMDVSFYKPTGKNSLQSFLPKFLRNQSIILVHNVHTTKEDLLFAQQFGLKISWCLCPNANLYIGGKLPDLNLLLQQGCEIVLGTDSLASNDSLSIMSEIRTLQSAFPEIPLENMLKWATMNGAKTLQVDSLMGSFEKGKKPGVVLIDEKSLAARRLTYDLF